MMRWHKQTYTILNIALNIIYMLCLIIRISSFRIELLVVLLVWLKAGDDNNSLCFEVCSSAYLAHNLIYFHMYLIQI